MSDKLSKIDTERLNIWQTIGGVHPFTCGSGNRTDASHLDGEGVLRATDDGWECPYCDYRQPYREIEHAILNPFRPLLSLGLLNEATETTTEECGCVKTFQPKTGAQTWRPCGMHDEGLRLLFGEEK